MAAEPVGRLAHPYLSLVIPTRNDEYPSNVLAIQNKSLLILQRQLEAAAIDSEILVVEYNPDPNRPPLGDSLEVDAGCHVSIQVITVDAKYHQRFRHWDRNVFHQTCAINVGLRRSRGEFFVYRAADHVYSEALLRRLEQRELRNDTIYRCDRVDVDRAAFDAPLESQLGRISDICERHSVRRSAPREQDPSYRVADLYTECCGDFLLMSRALWMRMAGIHEGRYPIFLDYDSLLMHAAYAACRHQEILPDECCVYKLNHQNQTAARLQQRWEPRWERLDRWFLRTSATRANLLRALLNYPARYDRLFPGVRLDSFERHCVLPEFLWAHGFPFRRQNYGNWGLGGRALPTKFLARAEWEDSSHAVQDDAQFSSSGC